MKTRHMEVKSRKRGALLADALLAVGVMVMIITFFAASNQREAQSQEDRMTGARTEIMSNAAKSYVAEQYDAIRDTLAAGGGVATDPAVLILTMEELADAGYLTESVMTGTYGNTFGQNYRLFIRGVLRSDTSWPQAVLTQSEIASLNTPDGNGVPALQNSVYDPTAGDDEMDLEAVLISEDGREIPRRRGGNITSSSGNPTMGYIHQDDAGVFLATGNLGSFEMPLAPWEEIGAVPAEGRLLTLISLSDGPGVGSSSAASIRGALRRCEDLTVTAEKDACLADGNKMYSNIVFANPAGKTPDYQDYPGIEGLKKIACREHDAVGRPTGNIDENLDLIFIDCGNVVISDDLIVQNGDLTVNEGDINVQNGTVTLNGNDIADNLIMATGEGLNGQVVPATPITEQCPLRPDGTRMEYKVQAWVNDHIEPVGRAMSGYRMSWRSASSPRPMPLAANPDPATGQFVVDVISFVHEDFCQNVSGGNLTPNNAAGGMTDASFTQSGGKFYYTGPGSTCGPVEGTGAGGNGDNYPDAYFLNDNQAKIQYAIYCE